MLKPLSMLCTLLWMVCVFPARAQQPSVEQELRAELRRMKEQVARIETRGR